MITVNLRPLTDDGIRPGTRIQYRNGRWGTVITTRDTHPLHDEVFVWDDSWGGETGTLCHAVWTSRAYLRRVAVIGDVEHDPNPRIHASWVYDTEETK